MAGMMGMVKLFVRNGVQVVQEVYPAYQRKNGGDGHAGQGHRRRHRAPR